MTKKKHELIEILLDNVNPEDWPENLPYAVYGKETCKCYASLEKPAKGIGCWWINDDPESKVLFSSKETPKYWNKTIVHRDEFMKRWNERNQIEEKTLTFSREGIDSFTVTGSMDKISIKPACDSEGWIQWNGGEMPVKKGTLIDVKYRRGLVNLHVKAGEKTSGGSIPERCAIDFKHDDNQGDIIAYRLHAPQQQKTPQQLALEKFGTDWHDNEGAQPVEDNVKIDVLFNSGDVCRNKDSFIFMWSKGLSQSSISKWRIHSDEKDSQIKDAASKALKSVMDKPYPMPEVKKAVDAAKSLDDGFNELNGLLPTAQQAFDGFKNAGDTLARYLLKNGVVRIEKIKPHPADDGQMSSEPCIKSPLSTQIGGDHYTKLAIQPMQYSMKNGLDPLQHTIIKYVTRFRDKAGIEDLEKAKHCIDMLIEFERDK